MSPKKPENPQQGKAADTSPEDVAEAKQEGREQAEQAWGKPMAAPQAPTVAASETAVKLDRKNFKSPLDMIRARFEHDPDFQGGI